MPKASMANPANPTASCALPLESLPQKSTRPKGGRKARGERAPQSGDIPYGNILNARECRVIYRAGELLKKALADRPVQMTAPGAVRDYLRLNLALKEREEFLALWLDAQHRLIEAETISHGTLTQTSVYPREVVKSALRHNAAAVIFGHNHPSGLTDPSRADTDLTLRLKSVLALVDVRVLDHFIVGGNSFPLSFAERGLPPFGCLWTSDDAVSVKPAGRKARRNGE